MVQFGVPRGDGCSLRGTTQYRARGGRNIWANNLDGTLPAELGKLTDLEDLCAALRRRGAAVGGPVGAACSGAAVVRSACSGNKLSGTIGSWIGSMARLTLL